MDEATETVGWTRTDVTVTDDPGVEGDSPNDGRTGLLDRVYVAMDATPTII